MNINLIPGILLKIFSTHSSVKFVSHCGSISNFSSEVPQLQKTLTKIGAETILSSSVYYLVKNQQWEHLF